jgi:hypothetical protein
MEDLTIKTWGLSDTITYFVEDSSLGQYHTKPKEEFTPKEEEIEDTEGKETDIKSSTKVTTDDSFKNFIDELFKTRIFIANENWEKTINVSSKIIQRDKNSVICECLIDKANLIFEKMSFPAHIFSHIDNYKTNPFVMLSIKSKVGSTRIDVIKGEGLVDKKAFELNEEWEKLDGEDFNQPLDKPLEL